MDLHLDQVTAIDASGDQLLSLLDEGALRHQSDVERQRHNDAEVFVQNVDDEVPRADKIEMVPLGVTYAGDSVQILFKKRLLCQRVPDYDAAFVETGETSGVLVHDDAADWLVVL